MKFTIKVLALSIFCLCAIAAYQLFPSSAAKTTVEPQGDAPSALSRGRSLLKQGHADQALPLLRTALAGFTQANNQRGIAAAEDALGDLYMVQGQYQVALDHYQIAYKSFGVASNSDKTSAAGANSAAGLTGSNTAGAATQAATSTLDNGFNANLMLAKVGDTNYRLGRMSEASSAYFMMTVKKPESAVAKATRRLGGLGAIGGIMSGGRPSVEAPTSAGVLGITRINREPIPRPASSVANGIPAAMDKIGRAHV